MEFLRVGIVTFISRDNSAGWRGNDRI